MDEDVLADVLGSWRLDRPATRRTGLPIPLDRTSDRRVTRVLRTRAELRAALADAATTRSASCRPWAGCMTAIAR